MLDWPIMRPPDYTIVPRNRSYWIKAIEKDGSRRTVERFDTEDMAVQRLRMLQEKEGVVIIG